MKDITKMTRNERKEDFEAYLKSKVKKSASSYLSALERGFSEAPIGNYESIYDITDPEILEDEVSVEAIKKSAPFTRESGGGTSGLAGFNWYIKYLKYGWDDNSNQPSERVKIEGEIKKMNIKDKINEFLESNGRQIIFNGAPGTGKTFGIRKWMIDSNCVEFESFEKDPQKDKRDVWQFIQFHPSYDYTDFMEGLRPAKLSPDDNNPTFVRMDGIFKRFCRAAAMDEVKERKFFFVIDEINRADLGKVFGELMFGLEEDYRDKKFPTQYMNLPTYRKKQKSNDYEIIGEEDVFADGFYIPENVYIIGTMNDIDRSVDSLDFAMRRRFKWEEVEADAVMESVLKDMFPKVATEANNEEVSPTEIEKLIKELVGRMGEVNKKIIDADKKLGLSKDYCLGPAYLRDFISYAEELASQSKLFNMDDEGFEKCIDNAWNNRIEQIIVNYCRGRDEDARKRLIDECKAALSAPAPQKKSNGEDNKTDDANSKTDVQ